MGGVLPSVTSTSVGGTVEDTCGTLSQLSHLTEFQPVRRQRQGIETVRRARIFENVYFSGD